MKFFESDFYVLSFSVIFFDENIRLTLSEVRTVIIKNM